MRPGIKSFATVLLGLSLLVPMAASAASLTTDQVNAIVSLLQSFGADSHTINSVQAVLSHQGGGMMGTSTMPGMPMPPPSGQMRGMICLTLPRNLGIGSQGDDVRSLQAMLAQDPTDGFNASTTGFFGPATAKAIMSLQMKNGIASSAGTVGPLTRAFFGRACGKGSMPPRMPPPMMQGSSTMMYGNQSNH